MTYLVLSKDSARLAECESLDAAMCYAKTTGQFVTIRSPEGTEFVGKFGADTITNGGLTPDGYVYEWKKDFSLKRRKHETC